MDAEPPRLDFIFEELPATDTNALSFYLEQLTLAAIRIRFVFRQFGRAIDRRRPEVELLTVQGLLETNLVRSYELRERLISVLSTMIPAAHAAALKKPSKRRTSLQLLEKFPSDIAKLSKELLETLDRVVPSRNTMTHGSFGRLRVIRDGTVYEIPDILEEFAERPRDVPAYRRTLRVQYRRLFLENARTAKRLFDLSLKFVHELKSKHSGSIRRPIDFNLLSRLDKNGV